MSAIKKQKSKFAEARVNVPLSMPKTLEARVEETAERVKLSKQDVMRLSMERGLAVLEQQLTGSPVAA